MGLLGKVFGGSPPPENDVYHKLRNRALNVTARELGLEADPNAPIHAVIMETGYPDVIATFACLGDGTVSLYLSTGGGVIGGGQHESVRSACFELLRITNKYAQDFMAACKRVSTFALPGKDAVFFYLVTSDGVYQAECQEDALAKQRDPFSALFNNCHAVMSELREVEQKR
ncbi:MAG TPA: hypothetical protein VE714_10160 [Gemmatimonadales bacterium]|nr:hypothetical protein [Gemmatimonadales bacterium]